MVRNAQTVQEILQEAATRYYAAPKNSIRQPAAWFRKVAVRCAIDCIRDQNRSPFVDFTDPAEPTAESAAAADSPLHEIEVDDALTKVLRSLPHKESELLQLRYFRDQELDELAKHFNTTRTGVKQRILRVLRKCRTALLEVGIETGAL